MESFYNGLCEIAGSDNVLQDEHMKNHTTFQVGGVADYYVKPHSEEEIRQLLKLCIANRIEYYIIGNGSNLLVGDAGFRGVIIQIFQNYSGVKSNEELLIVKAGTLMSKTANAAYEEGLTGLEFGSGIPGTIGGAIAMNAGAYGGEMSQIVTYAKVIEPAGKLIKLTKEELKFGYRSSVIREKSYIVLEVGLKLTKGIKREIKEKMTDYAARRKEKQPLEYPSAGSTFKRPEGMFAGKLIMDAGLSGFTVGGAKVSDKHCGFVINYNNATAVDITTLVKEIQTKVQEKFGVNLELEVQKLGDFTETK